MKKIMLYILIIVIFFVVVAGSFAIFNMVHFTVSPNIVAIRSVDVSPKAINISGDFVASAVWLAGYKTQYSDDNLYIRIIGSSINYYHLNGGVNLSIPNTYGNIKAVYIVGGADGGVMIWPDNKNLRHSLQ
ncbi:MAG TPA: hypothetical protein VMC41_03840 [Candidatus Nanoarchaeia archaeon]|nr:hypothetical protein [Candidatus Nanoarchaeia archaeon]